MPVWWRLYWVTQKLQHICTVIFRIRIGKVASFEVCICGNFWVIQYVNNAVPDGGLTSSSSSDTSASSDFSSSNHLHFKFTTYCMSKKSWPVLYCNLLRKDYWAVMNIYIFNCLKILTDCFRDSCFRAAPFSRFFSSSVYNWKSINPGRKQEMYLERREIFKNRLNEYFRYFFCFHTFGVRRPL